MTEEVSRAATEPAVPAAHPPRPAASLAILAILLATACWASSGVLAKKADLPGVDIAFWRLLMVAMVFGTIAAVTRRRISWAMVRRALPGGLLFGLNLAVWFEALNHASVGIATVLAALTPVIAMLVGWQVLDEHISRVALVCAAAAIGGVVLFVVPGFSASGTTAYGMALAAAGVGLWVCYLFVTKQARQGVGTVEYLLIMSAIATASLVPFVLVFGDNGLAPPDHGWPWLIALALVPGSLGHGLLVWAQAHVSLSTTSILLQGEPVGAAAAGVVFLDEPIGPLQVIGMTIAVVALVILARHSAGAA